VLHEAEERRTELLQHRVVELRLPFDPGGPHDPKAVARLHGVLEQRGLADTGVPVHNEHAAAAVPGGFQQTLEHRALALPTEQRPRVCGDDHPRSMPSGSGTTDLRDSIDPGREVTMPS